MRFSAVEKGVAEIEGVSEDVRREFSRRRVEIEEWLEREGRSGRRSAEKAARATRAPKEEAIDMPSWREATRARAAEHGLGRSELQALESRLWEASPIDHEALGSWLAGPGGLTERHNTFEPRDVVVEWAAAHRDGAPVEQIEAGMRRFLGRRELVPLASKGDPAFTTEELLRHERAIVDIAAERRAEGAAMLRRREVERALRRRDGALSDQQRTAVLGLATSGHGVESVEALAGTGKTHLAGAIRDVYADAGLTVVGVAPTGRAARELREQAGIDDASTLARLRMDLEQHGGFSPRTVVILDEAGMASTRETAVVMAAARTAGAKVIAIGDPGQLASVEAGGWLGSLRRRQPTYELTEVMRQRDPFERRLLAELHARRPVAYLRHKRDRSELRLYQSAPEAERALVAEWRRRQEQLPYGQAVMIARDNATRERLNEAARERLQAERRLGEAIEISEREFAVGDRVIARRNDRFHDVDNGMRGTVRAIDRDTGTLTVETDASGMRELPGSYVAEHLEHAYALTGHGMQGGTVEWAGVAGSPPEFTGNWSYTALSRGREPTEIYLIADEDRFAAERSEIAPADEHVRTPLQRMAAAMRRRDDEDLALERVEPTEMPGADPAPRRPEPPAAPPVDLELAPVADLRAELAAIEARLASYPEREADKLDGVRAQRVEAERTIAAARARIAGLEAERRPDAQALAFERARLAQAERAHGRHRQAEAELVSRVPDRSEFAAETSDLGPRRDELFTALEHRREAHLREALARPGPHLERALGPRPQEPRARETWERAATVVERYRFDHDIRGPSPLGKQPAARDAELAHRKAQRELERANRSLGREITRAIGREI